ncbi:hypothetical protein ABVK25_011423 [Lepraria finkii]|uniref:Uncharacterized protein n=1 Tax=Lepraria finkii TaxID=1340010 RepID=A0ABR4AQP8_9LECA
MWMATSYSLLSQQHIQMTLFKFLVYYAIADSLRYCAGPKTVSSQSAIGEALRFELTFSGSVGQVNNATVHDVIAGINACIAECVQMNLANKEGIAWLSLANDTGTIFPNGWATSLKQTYVDYACSNGPGNDKHFVDLLSASQSNTR